MTKRKRQVYKGGKQVALPLLCSDPNRVQPTPRAAESHAQPAGSRQQAYGTIDRPPQMQRQKHLQMGEERACADSEPEPTLPNSRCRSTCSYAWSERLPVTSSDEKPMRTSTEKRTVNRFASNRANRGYEPNRTNRTTISFLKKNKMLKIFLKNTI